LTFYYFEHNILAFILLQRNFWERNEVKGKLLELAAKTFRKEVLEESKPVLVDFWAEWCGPCKMLSPILEDLAKEVSAKVKFAKLNVDENTTLASEYRILSIPALLLFKDGKVISQKVGLCAKSELKKWLEENSR
jgi:thioredoxin 1